ncbi:unnamed protein product, partial [Rotaria socialis]
KSSESLTNIEYHSTKQIHKSSKMKKSQTVLNGFEAKIVPSPPSILNSTSVLRRRFSLFRMKRPQQLQQTSINDVSSNENS